MSDQPKNNLASFFEQEQSKKKKQQSQQQKEQQKKAEELKRKAEEEKKAAQTASGNGDYESGEEEEETRGKIDVGAGKVKDIKEVKKAKEAAKDAQKAQDFDWNFGGASSLGGASEKPKQEQPKDNKGGFARDQKKPDSFSKDGINFAKSRPQFKKSEHVGNKGEFPELGD